MGKRTTRIAVIGSLGLMLLVAAFLAGSPVTATGTGSCDPFDVSCLKTTNLYGTDICSSTNTNCLVAYQSLGIAVCSPTNTACATTYASVIRTSVPTIPVGTVEAALIGTPVSNAALVGTALASGTGIPSIIPPNVYGIDLCALSDTNCLLAKQTLGVPICPPDDQLCRDRYNSIYSALRTYTPRDQTPYAQSTANTGGYNRYVVGNSNDPNTAGIIHTLGR